MPSWDTTIGLLKSIFINYEEIGKNLLAWEFVWGGSLQKIIGGVPRYGLTVFAVLESDNPETMPDC